MASAFFVRETPYSVAIYHLRGLSHTSQVV